MENKTSYEKAIDARAAVRQRQCWVEAAQAAWEAAFREADPDASLPGDPEVEWCEPQNEEEALADLRVARLGGELRAARVSLDAAKATARNMTRLAMQDAASEGRRAWCERHTK